MSNMRAKFRVSGITQYKDADGNVTQETLRFDAVCKSESYPADGSDENNTFAKFTPSAHCEVSVLNPALLGQFVVGEQYYADFTKAE